MTAATAAVAAVAGAAIDGDAERKAAAFRMITEDLKVQGIQLAVSDMNLLIEAAVKRMKAGT